MISLPYMCKIDMWKCFPWQIHKMLKYWCCTKSPLALLLLPDASKCYFWLLICTWNKAEWHHIFTMHDCPWTAMNHAPSASFSNILPYLQHLLFSLFLFAVWQGSLSHETQTWKKQTDRLSYKKISINTIANKWSVMLISLWINPVVCWYCLLMLYLV